MNRHNNSPHTQNAAAPDHAISVTATVTIAVNEPTMTGFEPSRSSSSPPSAAPTAAIRLAPTPNNNTSAAEIPYTLTPSTAPNVATPVSPSLNTALARR